MCVHNIRQNNIMCVIFLTKQFLLPPPPFHSTPLQVTDPFLRFLPPHGCVWECPLRWTLCRPHGAGGHHRSRDEAMLPLPASTVSNNGQRTAQN